MTTKDEALRRALEALVYGGSPARTNQAITAIREALAQPAGERVGYALAMAVLQSDLYHKLDDVERAECDALLSSDAQPSEWVGLSDEERLTMWAGDNPRPTLGKTKVLDFAKAIEAKLREKNAGKPASEDKAGGEPTCLPCCGYADGAAIKWNPHNGAVQCHNCGQVYTRPQPQADEPVATGTWEHLKLMMEESAWDGKIELADALANIVDFEKYYTRRQPQGEKE